MQLQRGLMRPLTFQELNDVVIVNLCMCACVDRDFKFSLKIHSKVLSKVDFGLK